MNNFETSIVSLTMSDNTNTTHIATTSHHCDNTSIKLDGVRDLPGRQVDFDGIVDLDCRIWVSDSIIPSVLCHFISNQTLIQRLIDTSQNLRASIVRDQEWDATLSNLHSLDLAQLVFGFALVNSVDGESALDIVHKTEMLAGLIDRDDVHVTRWVCVVCSNLAVDFDQSLHQNLGDFSAGQSIFESVSKEDD